MLCPQASLAHLDLEYVDLVFCHRPDVTTPIEETVRAMNFCIEQGWAFYCTSFFVMTASHVVPLTVWLHLQSAVGLDPASGISHMKCMQHCMTG